jgi:hypothetical protein
LKKGFSSGVPQPRRNGLDLIPSAGEYIPVQPLHLKRDPSARLPRAGSTVPRLNEARRPGIRVDALVGNPVQKRFVTRI